MDIIIRDKFGALLKTKNKYCDEDINILVDESALTNGVVMTTNNWVGTYVPTQNVVVKKLYINTELTSNEVVEILEKLSYIEYQENMFITSCFSDLEMANTISIIRDVKENGKFSYRIDAIINGQEYDETYSIFSSAWIDYKYGLPEEINEQGWLKKFDGVLEFNAVNEVCTLLSSMGGVCENEKMAKLFSTTPFIKEEDEVIALDKTYDGSTVELKNLYAYWRGKEVKLGDNYMYVNTKLSIDEVKKIVSQMPKDTLTQCDFSQNAYVVVSNKYANQDFPYDAFIIDFINEDKTEFKIFNEKTREYLFTTENNQGWLISTEYSPIFDISTQNQFTSGYNNLLSGLFSSVEVERVEENLIDVKKYLDENKLPLKIKVNLETNGIFNTEAVSIDVPKVSNIQLSSDGILSFTKPDISFLQEEYNPTMTFKVTVNNDEFEISDDTLKVFDSLIEGNHNNEISIVTKLVLYDKSVPKEENILYSFPEFYCQNKMETPISSYSASCVFNDFIYVFNCRLNSGSSTTYYNIMRIDVNAKSCEHMINLPNYAYTVSVYGTDIYAFSNSAIYVYDTITNTHSVLDVTLYYRPAKSVVVGDKMYLFGSSSNSYRYSYQIFDINNNTVTDGGVLISNVCFHYSSFEVKDNYIYIFSYTDDTDYWSSSPYYYKFDTNDNSITRYGLNVRYPSGYCVRFENEVYLFSGRSRNTVYNTIKIFDLLTETVTTLQTTMPYYMMYGLSHKIGDDVYILNHNIASSSTDTNGTSSNKLLKVVGLRTIS